jgi:hypothetical protein
VNLVTKAMKTYENNKRFYECHDFRCDRSAERYYDERFREESRK